jgi:transposase
MNLTIAAIDVHKRVLMVVVAIEADTAAELEKARFGTTTAELTRLQGWLKQRPVHEVVMESTAQYGRPVWLMLEGHFRLHLAQAWSNRAPRGKKSDFQDAERLLRRQIADELTLSFVPAAEQRQIRDLNRRRVQLTRDRVRIQNQVESLLEETRIKISSVLTDLFGASGLRILAALAKGESDPAQLAKLVDNRVKGAPDELADALTGSVDLTHRRLLKQHLDHLELIDKQVAELDTWTAESMRAQASTIARLCDVPGIRLLAAQQIIAEVGPSASAFDSAPQLSAWVGASPGREESAEKNRSNRSTKGNPYLRRTLCQVAQAAVRTNHSFFSKNSSGCCLDWGIRKPSGQLPVISLSLSGRFCTMAPLTSNMAPLLLPKPPNDVYSALRRNSEPSATPTT